MMFSKRYTATVKEGITETIVRSNSVEGVQLMAGLFPGQRWKASKKGHYWYLTRQQSPCGIRLTAGAMKRLFDLAETE